jgi:hypothetical protein
MFCFVIQWIIAPIDITIHAVFIIQEKASGVTMRDSDEEAINIEEINIFI